MPGRYNYPLSMSDRISQRITFQPMEVTPPQFTPGNKTGFITRKTFDDLFSLKEADRRQAASDYVDAAGAASITKLEVNERSDEKVSLYLNAPHVVNDAFSYNTNTPLNISGAFAQNALETGGGVLPAAFKGIVEGAASITDLFTGRASELGARIAVARLANSPAGFLVPEGIRNAIGLAGRVTVNPNIRTTFEGVAIRQFRFNFKFLPKSPEESREVRDLIKLFRLRAYPFEIRAGGVVPIGFNYPDMFKIKLQTNVSGAFKNVGTPIKLSYLNSIQHVYNPTSQTFHADGSPVEIDLDLNFVEYKTLAQQDIEMEGSEDFYDIIPKEGPGNNAIQDYGKQQGSYFSDLRRGDE